MAIKPAIPKFKSPAKPKCIARPSAASAKAIVVGVRKPARVLFRIDPQSMVYLLPNSLFSAQQSLRSNQQDDNQDYQRPDVLQVGRDDKTRHFDEHSNN